MGIYVLIAEDRKYMWLSPYSFAGLNPLNAVDLDGLEAYFIHGTWSNPSTFTPESKSAITEITGNKVIENFDWSGYNLDWARREAAERLAKLVMETRKEGEPLTLVGHSHGGNVAIMAANILYERHKVKVDYLITFNTPVREEYQLKRGAAGLHVNVYNPIDIVQRLLGGDDIMITKEGYGTVDKTKSQWVRDPYDPKGMILIPKSRKVDYTGKQKYTGEVGFAGGKFRGAININAFHLFYIHGTHRHPSLWKEKLREAIGRFNK